VGWKQIRSNRQTLMVQRHYFQKGTLMGAGTLTDEQLLKRANHAGRNLAVLRTLAILGAAGMWAVVFSAKAALPIMAPAASALTLLAAGYWSLMIAALRGNPVSVGVVLVIMVIQLAVVLVGAGIAAARNKPSSRPTWPDWPFRCW
jgi:hypothetical protein